MMNVRSPHTTTRPFFLFLVSGTLTRTSLLYGTRTSRLERHSTMPILGPELKIKHSSRQHLGEIEPKIFSSLHWKMIRVALCARCDLQLGISAMQFSQFEIIVVRFRSSLFSLT